MAAFNIQSDLNTAVSSLKSLYLFLNDFKNFNQILPHEKVENFVFSEHECSFSIKGITPMRITRQEEKPYHQIVFKSDGLAKFNFTLIASFIGDPELSGQCQVELKGDLNPFILSMAEKSLKSLVNTMSQKLAQLNLPNHEN
ncbi:MAG: hypothetical protein WCR21_06075 [Bacteroidota bacterium]